MPLSVGTKLGPYEILAPIGAGGMGEVYRAHDPRLGRDVAIKVSAEKFSDRFEREARAIASLNHPNICQLYDVGPNYLVMELINGTPLKGPLPVAKALDYARQILDAMDAAHTKDITHRDLKPANILVTKLGIKLLDFGLARQSGPLKESDATQALTEQGVIIGTLNYMSPEQLQSKPADARSDIFSFGLVLYEMLTGKRAFGGSTAASVIAGIMERPALSVAEVAPPALDRILQTALAKDPEQRWQSARDLRSALDLATVPQASPSAARPKPLGWIAAALFAVIAAVALWALGRTPAPASHPLMRFNVDLGPDALPGPRITALISPDGTRLAFIARSAKEVPQLATRRLDQENTTLLTGTENAVDPFFSPDSQWIGFFADRKMKKVSVDGGGVVVLCDAFDARGAWWGEDGNIIFTPISSTGGLSRVSAAGGTPEILTRPSAAEVSHRWPQILPGGDAVLFSSTAIVGNYENGVIQVLSLKTGQRKRVYSGGYFGRYLAASKGAGYFVFVHQGTMFGAPFDLKKMEVAGAPTPLVDRIAASTFFGSGQFEVSSNGTLIYAGGDESAAGSIVLINRAGDVSSPLPFAAHYGTRFSPDGKLLAGQVDNDVQVYDLERNRLTRVTLDRINSAPIWTPDGKHLIFRSDTPSSYALRWTRADGAGEPQTLFESKHQLVPYCLIPGTSTLAYADVDPQTDYDIWTLPLDLSDPEHPRAGKPDVLLRTQAIEAEPAFTPDGKWIAYSSEESGRSEIYVRSFPITSGGRRQISTNSGQVPVWSPKTRQLFFDTLDGHVMAASYTINGSLFQVDAPQPWTNSQLMPPGNYWNFDVAPDGQHIAALLAPAPDERKSSVHVTVLLNFFDEVRRRAPAGR